MEQLSRGIERIAHGMTRLCSCRNWICCDCWGMFWNWMARKVCDGPTAILCSSSGCDSVWLTFAGRDSKILGCCSDMPKDSQKRPFLQRILMILVGLAQSCAFWQRNYQCLQIFAPRGLEIPTLILAWKSDGQHPLESAQILHAPTSGSSVIQNLHNLHSRIEDLLPRAQLCVAESWAEIEEFPARISHFLK